MGKLSSGQQSFILGLKPKDDVIFKKQKNSFLDKYISGLTRTSLCQHNFSCCENVIKGFFQTFRNILVIKVVANNLMFFGNPRKLA